MIPHSFLPEAAAELEDAAVYYETCSTGLGRILAAEVEHTLELIRQFPDAGTQIGPGRRRPGYWRRRK